MRYLGVMMHRVCLAVRGQTDAVEGRLAEAEQVAREQDMYKGFNEMVCIP